MEFVIIPAFFVGGAIYLGYISMTPEKVNQTLARPPVPIYEMSGWYGSTSDTIRFNTEKVVVDSYVGQFGIPEIFIADGKGCLTRLSDIGLGSGVW